MNQNELKHYGVLGMKWGIRRNQDINRVQRYKKDRKQIHPDYAKAHSKKRISEMSNRELKERNKRLQSEQQYKQLTKRTSVGKKTVQTFIQTAGTLSAAYGAYQTYEKFGKQALSDIGETLVSQINDKPWRLD